MLFFTIVYAQTTEDPKEVQELQIQLVRFDDEVKLSTENQPVFESLSKRLDVSVETLQAQKESTGFGFGQLFIANSLAEASGQTFDQMAEAFNAGKGWGEIAKANDLKLGKVVSGLKRANKDLKKARIRTERMRAEHGGHGNQQRIARPHGPAGVGGAKARGGGPHR